MCVYDNDESCENEESEDDSPNEKKKIRKIKVERAIDICWRYV